MSAKEWSDLRSSDKATQTIPRQALMPWQLELDNLAVRDAAVAQADILEQC